jgi:hypothetical protein
MDHAGANVKLNISAKCICLKTIEGNNQISVHDMPKISFASGGDSVSRVILFFLYTNIFILNNITGIATGVNCKREIVYFLLILQYWSN